MHGTLEWALELLLGETLALNEYETIPLCEALGRVTASDIITALDNPPFDRSPLDGYAVFHEDTVGASRENPVKLSVKQRIYAGDTPQGPLNPGEAARIMTGGMMPEGADCVVRQEDTDCGQDTVSVFVSLRKHENYCFRAEDIAAGKQLLERGRRLDFAAVGALAGQGFAQVQVFRRPKAGILSTGSELISEGRPIEPGKIYDSNRYTLAARTQSLGGIPVLGEHVPDDPARLAEALQSLLAQSDIVITTGGVSVGARDYMPQVGKKLGARQMFHGIAMKPGSPALALQKNGKLVLCLSGNPFAAAATFELLAAPVLRRLAGLHAVLPKKVRAVLRDPFPKPSHGRRFLRGRIEGGDVFLPGAGHASGKLFSLIGSNCMIDLPAGTPPLLGGEIVEAVLFDDSLI